MANTGVRGQIVDEDGNGVPGLIVAVFDREAVLEDVALGTTLTDQDGAFSLSYSRWSYGLEARPDLVIRVLDDVGRQLWESREYPDVSASTFDLGTVTLAGHVLGGWTVVGSPFGPTSGNRVSPLVDNERAWGALTRAVEESQRQILALLFYFDVGEMFTSFDPPVPLEGVATTGVRLEEAISERSKGGVDTRVIIRDARFLPYPVDTAGRVRDYFERWAPDTVDVRSYTSDTRYPMHAKFFVIDGWDGHLVGSPLLAEYFGSSAHRIDDPRRGDVGSLKNVVRAPIHDVGLRLQGPSVHDLTATFRLLWTHLEGSPIEPVLAPESSPARGNGSGSVGATVQIVRTLPGNTFGAVPDGETGILEAYLRGIGNAQDFIYLENQYLTDPSIARALTRALLRNPSLQLIMVLNSTIDIPQYHSLQTELVEELKATVEADATRGSRDRLGIFTLWTHEAPSSPPARIIRNYVHSKVGVVDDKWATVGSANLDGSALDVGHHVLPPTTFSDGKRRAIEVNAVMYSDVDGYPPNDVPRDLRLELWEEHLGLAEGSLRSMTRPTTGWLELWNRRAAEKLHALRTAPSSEHLARILEWTSHEDPRQHLKALGVDPEPLVVETEVRSFDQGTGRWK